MILEYELSASSPIPSNQLAICNDDENHANLTAEPSLFMPNKDSTPTPAVTTNRDEALGGTNKRQASTPLSVLQSLKKPKHAVCNNAAQTASLRVKEQRLKVLIGTRQARKGLGVPVE